MRIGPEPRTTMFLFSVSVGSIVNSRNCASARLVHIFPGCIPLEGFCSTAGNSGFVWNTAGCTVAREEAAVNLAVVIFLFSFWRIYREAVFASGKLCIAYFFFCHFFECINPVIANAVTELFLLSPCNIFRKQIFKGFTQNPFFNSLLAVRQFYTHLVCWIQSHCDIVWASSTSEMGTSPAA